MAPMSREVREEFLRGVHIGILGIERSDRAPMLVPVWYRYTADGEVQIVTDRDSAKVRALLAAGRFSLAVQTETAPYNYVSVSGELISLDPVDYDRDLRPLAQRYLGPEGGDRYLAETGGADSRSDSVLIRMRPKHWLSGADM